MVFAGVFKGISSMGVTVHIEMEMIIKKKRNGGVDILFNTWAIQEKKKYQGVFVLVASKEKDTFEVLRKFRRRE